MDSITNAQIEARALDVLKRTNSLVVPVPVEEVATHLGLRVEAAFLGDDVSGVLVIEDGTGTIGYNHEQHPVRQRFSVAHEIGHFVLHHSHSHLFIDKNYIAVYRRDQESSSGEQLWEIQANEFAAALLMPEELIRRESPDLDFDLGDEDVLKALAKQFQVSMQAMTLRLSHLKMLPSVPIAK